MLPGIGLFLTGLSLTILVIFKWCELCILCFKKCRRPIQRQVRNMFSLSLSPASSMSVNHDDEDHDEWECESVTTTNPPPRQPPIGSSNIQQHPTTRPTFAPQSPPSPPPSPPTLPQILKIFTSEQQQTENTELRNWLFKQLATLRPLYPAYASKLSRRRTYTNFRKDHPTVDDLVNAGFFYTQHSDEVRCYSCNQTIKNWGRRQNAFVEHARHSPTCNHIRDTMGPDFINATQRLISTYPDKHTYSFNDVRNAMTITENLDFLEHVHKDTRPCELDPSSVVMVVPATPPTTMIPSDDDDYDHHEYLTSSINSINSFNDHDHDCMVDPDYHNCCAFYAMDGDVTLA